jgi:hypothetical protein
LGCFDSKVYIQFWYIGFFFLFFLPLHVQVLIKYYSEFSFILSERWNQLVPFIHENMCWMPKQDAIVFMVHAGLCAYQKWRYFNNKCPYR